MLITEELLSPFRTKDGALEFNSHFTTGIPHQLFSRTTEVFSADWSTGIASDDPKNTLKIVMTLAFTRRIPPLKPGRTWLGLEHQCGGLACEQQRMIATPLNPRPSMISPFLEIAREGYCGDNGHFYRGAPILASRIVSYFTALARIGLDCECTYPHLTEALYPIDATQDNLDRIATDAPLLDEIADWTDFTRARYSDDPVIFCMVQNSD